MNRVFADAFYFVARLNRHDQHHDRVVAFSREFRAELITTEWVLLEVADALAQSRARTHIRSFMHTLRTSPMVSIVPADSASLATALEYYDRHTDKDWSLTDCLSFLVMQNLGLTEALTGDRHFEQAGFRALLK